MGREACRRCGRAIEGEPEQCGVAACALCAECWDRFGCCPHHSEAELAPYPKERAH